LALEFIERDEFDGNGFVWVAIWVTGEYIEAFEYFGKVARAYLISIMVDIIFDFLPCFWLAALCKSDILIHGK
jgi:hypothetical protein